MDGEMLASDALRVQTTSSQHLGMSHDSHDQRLASRHRVHGSAQVVVAPSQVLSGRIFDLSEGGVSVYLDISLPHGLPVQLHLNIFHNGKAHKLSMAGRSMYALLSSKEGFRNGFDFTHPDAAAQASLAQILA